MSNWPPKLNTIVQVNCKKTGTVFIGKVIMMLEKGAILKLINNKTHVDIILKDKYGITDKGLFLLEQSYNWSYYFGTDSEIENKVNIAFEKFRKGGCTEKCTPTKHVNTCTAPKKLDSKCLSKDVYDDTVLMKEVSKENTDLEYLFTDEKLEDDKFTCKKKETVSYDVNKIKENLKSERIDQEDIGIATSKKLSYDSIITSRGDEHSEARRIMEWLNLKLDQFNIKVYMKTHNGYIHIIRENCDYTSVVTKSLIPDLRFFEWQYDRPIDYNTLKNVLFRNSYQKKIKRDMEQLQEAKKILSLEYLIAFQPEPQYQLWCMLRLILCWLSDDILLQNIRKMKILINQYRSRPDQAYNKEFGVLPSIIVYPKYGGSSAKKVMATLIEKFAFYKRIGWDSSNPTYFIQVDKLIYYTNGLNDLKLYFRNVLNESGNSKNEVFDDTYTKIDISEDFFDIVKN